MAITVLNNNRLFLSNASNLYITPYTDEDTVGSTTYDVISIVADTLSITPDDNTVNTREWEFGDAPLYETVTLGKVQFAATCIDMQAEVLTEIFGWSEDTAGNVFAPTAYADKYAAITIKFHDATDPLVVLPKVKLNSKPVIASLKTSSGECQLGGTAYVAECGSTSTDLTETTMAFVRGTDVHIDGGDGTSVNVLAQ